MAPLKRVPVIKTAIQSPCHTPAPPFPLHHLLPALGHRLERIPVRNALARNPPTNVDVRPLRNFPVTTAE